MPKAGYHTIGQFLDIKLRSNGETIENVEAISISAPYGDDDEAKLLTSLEEIHEFLCEEHYETDLDASPWFLIWTTRRIYFLTTHNVGKMYEGDEDHYEYEISSLPRNPAAELIQTEY